MIRKKIFLTLSFFMMGSFITAEATEFLEERQKSDSFRTVVAPEAGVLVSLKVKENQWVEKGKKIAVMDCMKMTRKIYAAHAGFVGPLLVSEPGLENRVALKREQALFTIRLAKTPEELPLPTVVFAPLQKDSNETPVPENFEEIREGAEDFVFQNRHEKSESHITISKFLSFFNELEGERGGESESFNSFMKTVMVSAHRFITFPILWRMRLPSKSYTSPDFIRLEDSINNAFVASRIWGTKKWQVKPQSHPRLAVKEDELSLGRLPSWALKTLAGLGDLWLNHRISQNHWSFVHLIMWSWVLLFAFLLAQEEKFTLRLAERLVRRRPTKGQYFVNCVSVSDYSNANDLFNEGSLRRA